MSTLENITISDMNKLVIARDKSIQDYQSTNKISNILLIGIGSFFNNVLSMFKQSDRITKLCIGINENDIKESSNIHLIILDKEHLEIKESLWITKPDEYKLLYNEISKYQIFFTNYDYIVICTSLNNKEYRQIAEVLADYCSDQKKRFMICCTNNDYTKHVLELSNLSDNTANMLCPGTEAFISRMNNKNYIINQISTNGIHFLLDAVPFTFQNKSYFSQIRSNIDSIEYNKISIDIIAKIIEFNLISIIEKA